MTEKVIRMKTTGEALRELRDERSSAEVADAIGISETSLLAYERDEQTPNDGVKARIAKFYAIPVDTIFPRRMTKEARAMTKPEKIIDLKTIGETLDNRVFLPLEYLKIAMNQIAEDMIEKYEQSDNDDAMALACLLRTFARQVKEISDNDEGIRNALRKADGDKEE